MSQRLLENLEKKTENYIFPFFWQHGEDEETLREYMKVIDEANIKAVCVESRPHPDFVGPKWWEDMNVILDEAKKRDMRVWILDDSHFPTGMAAGTMEHADPELCKLYINYTKRDICGPLPQITLDVASCARVTPSPFGSSEQNSLFSSKKKRVFDDDKLLAVIASPLDGKLHTNLNHVDDTLLNLTDFVENGVLKWEVPKGTWRIFILYETHNGGGATDYINMIDFTSCQKQIEAVYEPHYKHYKEEFGKTIAGFFSDEPCLGNVSGFAWDNIVGKKQMPLPWSKEANKALAEKLGNDYLRYLPALWNDVGTKEFTAKVRISYMDVITMLMQKDFGEQIGNWCRERNVEYIGHIVEDNNASEKLGSSMGHFFRALWGQDMAGIDDIGGQLEIGGSNIAHNSLFSEGDGEFYHQVLAKLGSSLAQIDPKKKGRCMCEAFGAYGWGEGTRLMKYIADHLLVRGVNRFVPHAFSPRKFPDFDCPPHFYAQGENPLYEAFGELMKYINRMCHILDGGHPVASVALLYHAEAEWSGGDYMLMQKPARMLSENQIDFDIIPSDVFRNWEQFHASFDGKLHINGGTYETLVIPAAEFVSDEVLSFIETATQVGYPIFCIDRVPEGSKGGIVCSLEELPQLLIEKEIYDIRLDKKCSSISFRHYIQEDGSLFVLFQEDAGETFTGQVTFPTTGIPYRYDAMTNKLYEIPKTLWKQEQDKLLIDLTIGSLETAVIWITTKGEYKHFATAYPEPVTNRIPLSAKWTISFAKNKEYPNFKDSYKTDQLEDLGNRKPDFSGIVRYECDFMFDKEITLKDRIVLEFSYVREVVKIWCNDTYAGMVLSHPYEMDLTGLIKQGTNKLRIEVATTLEREVAAMPLEGPFALFATSGQIKIPYGIVGPITFVTKNTAGS